ncbi:MAG: type II toxin-antitoxin system ParD family antitoxin [Zymomonas sp.]|nr:MAG: type II toxin-antitoxin system ParD family antitoxin [Zymomonas sp.]
MDGNVDLGAHLESYVDRLIEEGGFASRDEVLREGVRLMEEREKAVWLADFDASIERAMADVEAGRVYSIEEVTDELRSKYRAMAEQRRQE